MVSLAASLLALALLGLGISRLTRRSPLFSSVRQVALGGVAAAVTYLVGRLVGGRHRLIGARRRVDGVERDPSRVDSPTTGLAEALFFGIDKP